MLLKCKKIHVKNEQKKPCHFLWAINGVVHKLLFTKTYFFLGYNSKKTRCFGVNRKFGGAYRWNG